MIRCIIVEDDARYGVSLINILGQTSKKIEVLAVCSNVDDAFKAINQFSPDLVFLDIELEKGETGFDLLKKFDNPKFEVIFTTGHFSADFAVNALRATAVDFLPKPLMREEVENALNRYIQRKEAKLNITPEVKENLNLKTSVDEKSVWLTKADNNYHRILLKDILYISGAGAYSHFFIQSDKEVERITTSQNIGRWETLLGQDNSFLRIHNSYIVNKNHISSYSVSENSVRLTDGIVLPVSRQRKSELLKLLSLEKKTQ